MAEQDRPPAPGAAPGVTKPGVTPSVTTDVAEDAAQGRAALDRLGTELAGIRSRQAEAEGHTADPRSARAVGKAWSLAIEMVAAVGVSVFIGWWLDRWLGTQPWCLLGFILLGIAAAMWSAIRTGLRMQAQQLADEARDAAAKKEGVERG
ncbi:AtpZ/AtpI family protein [Ferrovibrio sp.]|uniref:AtpZ/AtpI family protein n=1 Tax=Ferrovibrio sp. TaxID=1917215 RepID=UPI0035149815